MMHKHLLALLQSGYTTIEVLFMRTDGSHSSSKRYVYKAKTALGVQVGDTVIVDSPTNGLALCEVVGVHDTPNIDLDSPFTYKWIVQKVDRTAYDETLEQEAEFNRLMLDVERVRQRELLMGKFTDTLPEGSEARKIFDAAIAPLKASLTVTA